MAAISVFISDNVSYANTVKHAESFMSILSNANFRSLFLWIKEETKNRREGMDYTVIESVPIEMRVYIEDERRRQEN